MAYAVIAVFILAASLALAFLPATSSSARLATIFAASFCLPLATYALASYWWGVLYPALPTSNRFPSIPFALATLLILTASILFAVSRSARRLRGFYASFGWASLPVSFVLVAIIAFDVPLTDGGPSLPASATSVAFSVVSSQNPIPRPSSAHPACGHDFTPVSGNSIATLRASLITQLLSDCQDPSACTQGPCWQDVPDSPGSFYLATLLPSSSCSSDIKESMAVGNHTLYYLWWSSPPLHACPAGISSPGPSYRLLVVAQSDLPLPGSLTVEVQVQGTATPTRSYDTQASLS